MKLDEISFTCIWFCAWTRKTSRLNILRSLSQGRETLYTLYREVLYRNDRWPVQLIFATTVSSRKRPHLWSFKCNRKKSLSFTRVGILLKLSAGGRIKKLLAKIWANVLCCRGCWREVFITELCNVVAPVTVVALTGSESLIEVFKVDYNLLLLIFFPSGRLWWLPQSWIHFCDISKG